MLVQWQETLWGFYSLNPKGSSTSKPMTNRKSLDYYAVVELHVLYFWSRILFGLELVAAGRSIEAPLEMRHAGRRMHPHSRGAARRCRCPLPAHVSTCTGIRYVAGMWSPHCPHGALSSRKHYLPNTESLLTTHLHSYASSLRQHTVRTSTFSNEYFCVVIKSFVSLSLFISFLPTSHKN